MKIKWSLPTHGRTQILSDYLRPVLRPADLRRTIERAAALLTEYRSYVDFQALAFRGNSGAAIAFPLSAILGIPLIMVRKGSSHSAYVVEGALWVDRYVIVDDLIHSGNTVKQIVRKIRSHAKARPEPAGIYLYCESCRGRNVYVGSKAIPIINRCDWRKKSPRGPRGVRRD